ncbi:MAG: hypothetical protein NZ519_07005 [Bacteroidia bacterium]|nr:hypothetical protein [Bacteroidia bacterium]MDW8302609.1 hypothetical protein [Bacteroidia bacterium]
MPLPTLTLRVGVQGRCAAGYMRNTQTFAQQGGTPKRTKKYS